jgi:hypothetical protein
MSAPIAHFVSLEVGNLVETLAGFGMVTASGPWTMVAVVGMEAVVYVAMEAFSTVEPRASTNEYAATKPLGAIVAVGSAVVGWDVVVAVGTFGRDSDVDADLGLRFGCRDDEANCDERSQGKKFQSSHFVILGVLDFQFCELQSWSWRFVLVKSRELEP